ncbi:NAD(P)-dependent oxidoreductase [Pseudomonas sp. RIT-PI-AD]|uniref:NAD(P)-dependent oxidoreductase n=1 Tax=Pseudomonas sp. RIT-PI-AD TaxID=3035294 RepID=UPI0021D902E5|nr:NAD(P)-dependent oxidoreductase [Pseudomonas sp. RIT-PI-AD]
MSGQRTVAVYGLGNMGYLIAERIARHFPVKVSDLDRQALARAREHFDAVAIEAPDDLAGVDVVVLSLPSPAISRAVVQRIVPHLARGAVLVETSTVNPSDIQALEALLAPQGVELVDASVLAGVGQMAAGTAALAVGGSPRALDAAQAVLDAIAPRQIRFGELGAGAAAKVINNAVAHAVMVVVAEAGAMATAAGVACDQLIAMLCDAQMGIQRPLTHRYAERILEGNYAGGMPLDAARKDSVLALELAQSLGVPLFAIQGSHSVYEMAARAGYGRDDYAAVAKLWADWGKPTVPQAAG